MTTYTHEFRISINSIDVSGEAVFNNGNMPTVKFNTGMELPLNELTILNRLFEQLNSIYCQCGAIDEIRLREKTE